MMHIMNKLLIILSLVAVLTGCQTEFEKTYTLSVDAHEYTLSADGESFHLYVYCSGDWTAQLDSDADWIRILPGTEKGSGIGLVRLEVDYNNVAVREANLILTSGEYQQTIHFTQKYDSTHWEIAD